MNELEIIFPGNDIDYDECTGNLEEHAARPELLFKLDGTVITYEEVSLCLCDAFRLLGQLRVNSAARALRRLKDSEPRLPLFSFQIRDRSEVLAGSVYDGGLSAQPCQQTANRDQLLSSPIQPIALAQESGFGYKTLSHTSSPNRPTETIDPALLTKKTIDSDSIHFGNAMRSVEDTPLSDRDTPAVRDDGFLFVSPMNDGVSPVSRPETPNRGSPPFSDSNTGSSSTSSRSVLDEDTRSCRHCSSSTSSRSVLGEDSRSCRHSDPEQDNPTPSPGVSNAAQWPRGIGRSRRSPKSKLSSKVDKRRRQRQKARNRKPLDVDQLSTGISSDFKKWRLSICSLPVADTLYELSDRDLRGLILGEGLINENLLEYLDRNSCIWQENGFWAEDALDLCITTHHLAAEKICQAFRHARTLVRRGSDQKLRLRMSETLLCLSYEYLKQDTQQGIRSKLIDNPSQQRASTLSIDHLLERSYPDLWNSGDIQAKKCLRAQWHEHMRQGSRCWRTAGPLGLGALVAGGDLLIRIIKDHSKYPIGKYDAMINYIVNAHPQVVSLYHDFDDVVKQILHMKPLATEPLRQTISGKLSLLTGPRIISEQLEKNWQSVNTSDLSKTLVEEVLLDRIVI